MTVPLQGLLMAGEECMRDTLNGEKLITIREGHRDYRCGPVLIGCPTLKWSHMANIIEVKHTTLGEISRQELFDDNFSCTQEAILVLSKWYPNISKESPVTVIRWENK